MSTTTAATATVNTPLTNGISSWKLAHLAKDGLGYLVLNRAASITGDATWDVGALLHTAVTSVAGINDGLKGLLFPAVDEISMQAVTSWVTVGKNPWGLTLAFGPSVLEFEGVPVDLEKEMGNVNGTLRADTAGWPLHVVLVASDALGRIIAGWEVNVGTQRRGITITFLIGETNTGTSVSGILDTYTRSTIGVGWVERSIGVGSWAHPLYWLNDTPVIVEGAGRSRWRATGSWVTHEHSESFGEWVDLFLCGLEAVIISCDLNVTAWVGVQLTSSTRSGRTWAPTRAPQSWGPGSRAMGSSSY